MKKNIIFFITLSLILSSCANPEKALQITIMGAIETALLPFELLDDCQLYYLTRTELQIANAESIINKWRNVKSRNNFEEISEFLNQNRFDISWMPETKLPPTTLDELRQVQSEYETVKTETKLYNEFINLYKNVRKEKEQTVIELVRFTKNNKNNSFFVSSLNNSHFSEIIKHVYERTTTIKRRDFEFLTNIIDDVQKKRLNICNNDKKIECYNRFFRDFPMSKFRQEAIDGKESIMFEKIKNSNSIKEFDHFLQLFPVGKKSTQVRRLRESIFYRNAIDSNTLEDLNSYLEQYPRGIYYQEIYKYRETPFFNNVKERNTIIACDEYLSQYPDGHYQLTVNEMRENLFYKDVVAKNNIKAFDSYLSEYPNGKNIKKIMSLKEQQIYNDTINQNTVEFYDYYLIMYPKGRYVTHIQSLKEKKKYEIAKIENSIAFYNEYIEEYPNGKYLSEVKLLKSELSKRSLTITANVAGAKVKILNIKEKYVPEIRLLPGKYHIEVSAPQYIKQRKWVTVTEDNLHVKISLYTEKEHKILKFLDKINKKYEKYKVFQADFKHFDEKTGVLKIYYYVQKPSIVKNAIGAIWFGRSFEEIGQERSKIKEQNRNWINEQNRRIKRAFAYVTKIEYDSSFH